MGWFGDEHTDAYNKLNDPNEKHHSASLTHEMLAAAATFEAAKAYEQHLDAEGQPQSHETAKALLAGFAGAFVDREVETKGLDWIDRKRAKDAATEQLHNEYDNRYGDQ